MMMDSEERRDDICEKYSSLVRSDSRGIVTKHKQVVLRGNLAIPPSL